MDYKQIPNFPLATVESHHGKLIYGELHGKKVLAMQGRFHFYEGYSLQQVTFPIRIMKLLGIQHLLLSNAAGALNPNFRKGELMLIDDHINFLPDNPLRGPNDDQMGPRFPDMSRPYSSFLNEKLTAIAGREKIVLHKGVYASCCRIRILKRVRNTGSFVILPMRWGCLPFPRSLLPIIWDCPAQPYRY